MVCPLPQPGVSAVESGQAYKSEEDVESGEYEYYDDDLFEDGSQASAAHDDEDEDELHPIAQYPFPTPHPYAYAYPASELYEDESDADGTVEEDDDDGDEDEDGGSEEAVDDDEALASFDGEAVVSLTCTVCGAAICGRAMRVILIADNNTELFSTDEVQPSEVGVVGDAYITPNCLCEIRDIACGRCGTIVGYHVTSACAGCLSATNNGHYWLFHAAHVSATDRLDLHGKPLLWGALMQSPSVAGALGTPRYQVGR